MFQTNNRTKKRPRASNDDPLSEAVVCLTGLSSDKKEQYHKLVQELGGTFTRDFTFSNTHLISLACEGAKYEAAQSFGHVKIVRPTWLDACEKAGQLVDEKEHALVKENDETITDSSRSLNLLELVNAQLQHTRDGSVLFSACQFYLVDFEDQQLSRLIRRGLGTIHWDLNEAVTHVIVNDHSDSSIRQIAQSINNNMHTVGPCFCSPLWIVDSWAADELQDPSQYPPIYKTSIVKQHEIVEEQTTIKSSNLFRGSIFCLMRVTPPCWAVDFEPKEMEKSIRVHGGQMLSLKLLEALRIDGVAVEKSEQRKCYIICWGGYTQKYMDMHPLLAQIKRSNLAEIVQVTPIWLQTCFEECKVVSTNRIAAMLPIGRPMHKLDNIRICVSGFYGSKRTAIILLIDALTGSHDDSMSKVTTHLIVREASGTKYEKAKEWKLSIVGIEWLTHVALFGYGGEKGDKLGCEALFPPPQEKPTD